MDDTSLRDAPEKKMQDVIRRPFPLTQRSSIRPESLLPMDKIDPVTSSEDFGVIFIGAGNIMFGSDEGPWNHSFRFEHKLGPRFKVIALIDPAIERAELALMKKRRSFVKSAYNNTRIYASLDEFFANMSSHDTPKAILIGSPPMYRGSTKSPRDVELQMLKLLPGIPMFIETPVAAGPEEEIEDVFTVARAIEEAGSLCSVGYMLRYLQAVQLMKRIIEENNLTVMGTIARYTCAYEKIARQAWWDKSRWHGPIIEQATHFCDLSRYFGGEVIIPTVDAQSLEWDEPAGKLNKVPVDEGQIPPQDRIARVTSATWKYESGAVGTLMHSVAHHGTLYGCELEVLCDGWSMKLVNPYEQPVVYIRRPGADHDETHRFPDDDPFFSEVSHWIDALENNKDPDKGHVLAPFSDACRTYEFTWAIRHASERSRKTKRH